MLVMVVMLSGCVSQRYAGIVITSTGQADMTKIFINNHEVVMCNIKP